jgi:tetratricopeptide (TPR) repeat protein
MKLSKKQIEAIQFYKLGNLDKAINCFELSTNDNVNNELVHESLGICYMEVGKYQKSINNFIKVLDSNINNKKSLYSIINLLNFFEPKNYNENNLISVNEDILRLNNQFNKNIPEDYQLKKFFEESENSTKDLNIMDYEVTQIFRRKNKTLECDRHFKVFNKFNVIPEYCFNCYKIQIVPKNVFELIKLYFFFNRSLIEKSIMRKCMIELRSNVNENYKGLVYFSNLKDATTTFNSLKQKIIESKIKTKDISVKHGCSEFYQKHPDFKKINYNGKQPLIYDENWKKYESLIDNANVEKNNKKNLFLETTLNKFTLTDFLIIKNWLVYAKMLGDTSFENIFSIQMKNNFLKKILKKQYDFRKKEL